MTFYYFMMFIIFALIVFALIDQIHIHRSWRAADRKAREIMERERSKW
ncbi:MAG: hypothetical protein PBV01_11880 [Brucella anthropi]